MGVSMPGKSATFRYRVLVYDGSRTKEQLDGEYADFAASTHFSMLTPDLQ
ncbi:hypothetical protein [Schlesneria sp. T3-172]